MSVDSKPVRVVPSGQIYRQMFDAQLQLSRSLSRYDSESRIQRLKSRELTESQSFPVIHLSKEDTQHGILNSRQKTWASSFPNDPYTENPVLFKQYKEYVHTACSESESSLAGKEVRGLPDIVLTKKAGSDIIDRIAESRKQRHESAVEDMHQDLSVINTENEPKIEFLSAQLMNRLAENDDVIENILNRIAEDGDILTYQLEDLYGLWEEIRLHTPKRQAWIQEMDTELKDSETDRMTKIKNVFNHYGEKFHKISHLMPSDLQRFLDKESQMINQTILSNRRAYADLYVRLISADIEREKTQRTKWRRRVEDWKSLLSKKAIQGFREFMTTKEVIKPPSVENVRETLLIEQGVLNANRLELIKSLSDMKPPALTKTAVYKWRQDMRKLTEDLDNCTRMHMSKLHEEYEKVCQMCLDKVENCKTSLVEKGICTPHRGNAIVDEFLLPLVGEQQRVFEDMQEEMERLTEDHNKYMDEEIHRLFKFSQGAAHLWDSHEIGLAKQERALQEELESCRQKHDQSNQEKEANLDIVMDRMRQDASEMALKDSLLKALTMLEKIRTTYEEFHDEQSEIVKTYPNMVDGELTNYDSSVCKFFSVMHKIPRPTDEVEDEKPEEPKNMSDELNELGEHEEHHESEAHHEPERNSSGPKISPSSQEEAEDEEQEHVKEPDYPENIEDLVKEIIETSRGTEFYVVKHKETKAKEPPMEVDVSDTGPSTSFMTEVMDGDMEIGNDAPQPDYISSINIPQSVVVDVKKAIRFNVLDHLEAWCEQAIERSHSVVLAKCEELNSELDLRLHLHRPRPRRAELDIHNVRAAELVMHSERVVRHCNGMEKSLAELHSRFKAMSHEHNKLANAFRVDIEALEVIFVNATKSARLVKLQNQVSIELDKFMSVIRTSLRQFRQHLDETLQMLRESNARFIKSFKVFSDGGNFSPEEIEDYRKKLEKMSAMIDNAEGSIMSELEGMESKRLDTATKISVEFEDRFKGHMSDLVFMERVARWLTNTQVKIKGEVANSNTQAQRLEQMLKDLERRVDACEKPNLDKEQITATQLNDSLASIFEAFQRRRDYLNCAKSSSSTAASQPTQPASSSTKVGFSGEASTGPIKGGKAGSEDPSVNVIKSILNKPPSATKDRTQRSKMRFGFDAEMDGDTLGYGLNPTNQDSAREKSKSALSQASSKASEASKSTKKPGSVSGEAGPRRVPSGTRRVSKLNKSDKKFQMFGEKTEDEGEAEAKHFMAIIQKTLKEALDGLLTTAEVFYRQKGPRPVTRPQALQETFEQYAEIISQKMMSYLQQSDEYHNQCLQEFRGQLVRLEQLTSHVPSLVIKDLLKQEVQAVVDSQAALMEQFQSGLDELAERQSNHKSVLRPKLGHPNQSEALEELCVSERQRHDDYTDAVSQHIRDRQQNTLEQSKDFLEKLVDTAEAQLVQYDNMLVVDDVEKGRVDPKKFPTSELIRRQNAGEPLEDEEDKDALPRGKANWIGVPSNQFVLEGRPSKLSVTSSVATRKNTMAHTASIKARDRAYEDYKEKFERTLQQVAEEKERMMLLEKRWKESWESSVDKVKSIYQK